MGNTNDNYPTPPKLAEAIMQKVTRLLPRDVGLGLNVLEPGCGDNAPFLSAAAPYATLFDGLDGVDIRPVKTHDDDIYQLYGGQDFLQDLRPVMPGNLNMQWNLIITNPPYSLAQEFVERSLELVSPNGLVVMLLQTGFEGSKKRREFFTQYPWLIKFNIRPRPGFVRGASGASSDMREYAVYVWTDPETTGLLRRLGRCQSIVENIDGEGSWKSY